MSNGARKFDNDKAPVMTGVFLRFPRAMLEIAKVSKLGADKYEVVLPDDGFLQVENGEARYTDALGRHLLQRAIEGKWNTETGGALPEGGVRIRHMAQAAWDTLTALELELVAEEREASTKISTMSSRPQFVEDFQMGELAGSIRWIEK